MPFLSESSAAISLTFTNSKPMKRTLDRTQPPDRLQGQDPPGAGCQDAADAAARKPAPNTIHSRAGTKQESRQISPQKSHHEHKKTASESQFGSLLIKLEPQARTLLQPPFQGGSSPLLLSLEKEPLAAPLPPLQSCPQSGTHTFGHGKGSRHDDFPDGTGRRAWAERQPLQSQGQPPFTAQGAGSQAQSLVIPPISSLWARPGRPWQASTFP